MRLKSFNAPTINDAMRCVREEFGEDAIIVSSQPDGDGPGVRVTAAVEKPNGSWSVTGVDGGEISAATTIGKALSFHGVPQELARSLLDTAGLNGGRGATADLAEALKAHFSFRSIEDCGDRPLALVGPPGVRKTVSIAKLAAGKVVDKRSVRVFSTDNFRAGGVDQLAAITGILDLRLEAAGSPRELKQRLNRAEDGEAVLIDTAGVNPFNKSGISRLADLVASVKAEPVLTLAANSHPEEAAEIGEVFATVGCRMLLATRVDATRRIGAILAAADGGRHALAGVSTSPHVAKGLQTINGDDLARLLLDHPRPNGMDDESREARP